MERTPAVDGYVEECVESNSPVATKREGDHHNCRHNRNCCAEPGHEEHIDPGYDGGKHYIPFSASLYPVIVPGRHWSRLMEAGMVHSGSPCVAR